MHSLTVRLNRRQWAALLDSGPGQVEPWRYIDSADLQEAIAQLPLPFRTVIGLHLNEGLSFREIAGRLEVPCNTVAARMFRGRRQLRTILRERLPPDVRERVPIRRW